MGQAASRVGVVDLERLDPGDLDLPLATTLAAITVAAMGEVATVRPTGDEFLLETTRSDEPADALWVAREGGEVVGYAARVQPVHEYVDAAFLRGAVHPGHQRQGVGGALLGAVAEATPRDILRSRAWRGTAGAKALPALGFRRTMTHTVRRLSLADPPLDWSELRREAGAAARDYDLVRRIGPTPEANLPEMTVLREAINDSPDAHEYEAYPPERIAAYEQSLVARRQTQYTLVARHRRSGEPAGITTVCVPELAPELAAQEDTSVLPAHRGHRLGLCLKIEMADWLRAERPDVHSVDTWNEATNGPMIAVNQRLGTRIVAETSAYRRARVV
jgi:GNAT superfamily N-acetyltransferase